MRSPGLKRFSFVLLSGKADDMGPGEGCITGLPAAHSLNDFRVSSTSDELNQERPNILATNSAHMMVAM